MTRSLPFATLLAVVFLCACDGKRSVTPESEGPRLEPIADASVPPTAGHYLALVGDTIACMVESYEYRVLCGDRAWENVRSIGREGSGPSEFRAPTSLEGGTGGRIAVSDPILGRTTIFTLDGELVHTQLTPWFNRHLAVDEDEYVWYAWRSAEPTDSAHVLRAPLGEGEPTATLLDHRPPLLPGETLGMRAGTSAFGGEWVFWTGGYQLSRYSADGSRLGIIEPPPHEPELPNELDADLLAETLREYLGTTASPTQLRSFMERPKLPMTGDAPLNSDGRGRLWAATTRDHRFRSHFDVFEESGYVGTASVPDRVLAYDIHGDVLAALVLVPAASPDAAHGYRIRWYRIEG